MSLNRNDPNSAAMSLRKASIIAAIGLLLMAILAPIANFNAFQNLIVQDDSSATVSKIVASLGLFRTGICFFLIVAILDVLIAWALYYLFIPVDGSLSLLAALLRVVYAAVFAVATNHLFQVLSLLDGAAYLKAYEASQLNAQVMLHLDAFKSGWNSGMIVFGLHLLVLGYLTFKSGYFPRFLGVLIVIAGAGYLTDGFGELFLPGYKLTIAMFTFVGEVLFIFWLFLKGIKGFGEEPNSR